MALRGLLSKLTGGGDRGAAADRKTTASSAYVLLVDGSAVGRQLIKSQVENVGLRVHAVDTVDTAASVVGRVPCAVALICARPDGFDAALAVRRLRQAEGGRNLVSIGLTEDATPAHIKELYAAGMQEVIPLPVRAETLARLLGRWVTSQSAALATSRAAAATLAAVDEPTLLAWVGDDREILIGVIPRLTTDIEKAHELVLQGLSREDGTTVLLGTQALRSIAAAIGAAALDEAARALDHVLVGGDVSKAVPARDQLAEVVARCTASLQEVRRRYEQR